MSTAGLTWRVVRSRIRMRHLAWAVVSLAVFTLSALPGVVEAAARNLYVHNVEHMTMAIAGLLLGLPFGDLYRHGLGAWLARSRASAGRAAIQARVRAVSWGIVVTAAALDLLIMLPQVSRFVSQHPLAHALEHGVIYLLYALFGSALVVAVRSRPLAWLVALMYVVMLAMYVGDESVVMAVTLAARGVA
ncbi:MAG TPA: hypothetical protein VHN99_10055 [Deinococcales bacterium]|nr:hypothetical protein [Deinococcales bacterium]